MDRNHRAFQLWETGKVNEAIALLFQEIDETSDNRNSYYNLATILILSRKFEDAEVVLVEAEKKFPQDEMMLYAFGNLYYQKEDYPLAIQYFKKVNQLKHSLLKEETNRMMGQTYLAMDDPQKALVYLLQAESTAGQDPTILMMIGNALMQTGFFTEAERYFERTTHLSKDNDEAWFKRGVCRFASENSLKEAEPYFNKAKTINPVRFEEQIKQFKQIEKTIRVLEQEDDQYNGKDE
ncbi:tetratricopeptide repeat protein [Pisciglobus halotolerans]|uniref:Tetratricopeptide repeat-containing protein n=1 Tax=Pisciglobus halotolerans TaxID=745365 RepID=A0A1I3DE99_9LACT|nr:tetratricopeptide repeat protein [Pisciglobus halotolerans]SFH85090.1 Tetratricopeptide repeat-containing protein [Pisciglobus halotolerans]